jgi:hypothetical protein
MQDGLRQSCAAKRRRGECRPRAFDSRVEVESGTVAPSVPMVRLIDAAALLFGTPVAPDVLLSSVPARP